MIRPCFYCGWRPPSYQRLVRHLINNHASEGFMMSISESNGVWCVCRCAGPFAINGPAARQTLAQHLKEQGGLDAHLLAIGLGLETEHGR